MISQKNVIKTFIFLHKSIVWDINISKIIVLTTDHFIFLDVPSQAVCTIFIIFPVFDQADYFIFATQGLWLFVWILISLELLVLNSVKCWCITLILDHDKDMIHPNPLYIRNKNITYRTQLQNNKQDHDILCSRSLSYYFLYCKVYDRKVGHTWSHIKFNIVAQNTRKYT